MTVYRLDSMRASSSYMGATAPPRRRYAYRSLASAFSTFMTATGSAEASGQPKILILRQAASTQSILELKG